MALRHWISDIISDRMLVSKVYIKVYHSLTCFGFMCDNYIVCIFFPYEPGRIAVHAEILL